MTDETTEVVAPETVAPQAETAAPVTETAEQAEPSTEGQTDEAAASDEQNGDPTDEAKPKKKGGFQKRIEELTAEKYREKLEKEHLQRELEQFKAKQAPAIPTEKPDINNYTSIEEYNEALVSWAKAEGAKEAELNTAQRAQAEKQLQLQAQVAAREDVARTRYTDYDQVIDPIGPVIVNSPVLKEFVTQSEMGLDVAYHLGKNPHKLAEIAQMPPFQAVRELINLETRLKNPPPKPITKAPDPIKPVGSAETVRKNLAELASTDMKAYMDRRNKQELARRKT